MCPKPIKTVLTICEKEKKRILHIRFEHRTGIPGDQKRDNTTTKKRAEKSIWIHWLKEIEFRCILQSQNSENFLNIDVFIVRIKSHIGVFSFRWVYDTLYHWNLLIHHSINQTMWKICDRESDDAITMFINAKWINSNAHVLNRHVNVSRTSENGENEKKATRFNTKHVFKPREKKIHILFWITRRMLWKFISQK